LKCPPGLFAASEVNFASGKAFKREAKSALGAIYAIVGSAGSWHNQLAVASVRRRRLRCLQASKATRKYAL
jgi:hypothetical protein